MKKLLILSTLFLLFQAVNGQSVQDKARLERERQEIQQELQAIQSEYNKLKKKSKASIGELTALQRKMEVQNKYIGNINREIRSINDDIYLSAVEINRMQVQLDTLKAQYALDMLRDDNRLQQFKQNASEHARNFDIHNIVPIYEKLYDDVLSKEFAH